MNRLRCEIQFFFCDGSSPYPFIVERSPGELWIWARYGSSPPVYLSLHEKDLIDRVKRAPETNE